jgi:hypothetical protein
MPVHVSCYDGIPSTLESPHLPWVGTVPAGGHTVVLYSAKAFLRGQAAFGKSHNRHSSPLRPVAARLSFRRAGETRVYPNYEPVVRYNPARGKSARKPTWDRCQESSRAEP